MDEVLQQVDENITGEQYPLEIKDDIEKVEVDLEGQIQGNFDNIRKELLGFVTDITSVKKATEDDVEDELESRVGIDNFIFDLSVLYPAAAILIGFENDRIKRQLVSFGVDIISLEREFDINLGNLPSGGYLDDVLKRRTAFLAEVLRDSTLKRASKVIAKGMEDGLTYDQIAKNLETSLGFDKKRALSVARTETNFAINEGLRVHLAEIGVKKMKISTAIDACEICKEAATREYSVREAGILPLHPNDRCIWMSVIPEEWLGVTKALEIEINALQKVVSNVIKSIKTVSGEVEVKAKRGKPGKRGLPGETGKRGDSGKRGGKGEPGERGLPGEAGYTPVVGKDFFTEEDTQRLVNEVLKSSKFEGIINKKDVAEVSKAADKKISKLTEIINSTEYVTYEEMAKSITRAIADIQILTPRIIKKFIKLSDTPESYTGNADRVLTVNDAEDATEFRKYIENIDTVGFDINYVPTESEPPGTSYWDQTNRTTSTVLLNGVVMQNGQEDPVPCYNLTGVEIPDGTPVYITGRQGNLPTIAPAISNTEPKGRIYGVTTSTFGIAGDERLGYVTKAGLVKKIKTNYTGTGVWGTTWAVGNLLYTSKTNAGVITNVEPPAPHHADILGSVAVLGTVGLGVIDVNINRHVTLAELADVDGTPLITTGQIPVYHDGVNGFFDFDYNINDYLLSATASTTYLAIDGSNANTTIDIQGQDLVNVGNLGVGTNNPLQSQHLFGAGNIYNLVQSSTDNQVGTLYKSASYEWAVGIHAGQNLFKISNSNSFGTNDVVYIDTSQRVGIGGIPTTEFEVFTKISGGGVKISASGGSSPGFRLYDNDTTYFAQNLLVKTADNGISGTAVGEYLISSTTGQDILFATSLTAGATRTEVLRITKDKKLGLGTTSPQAKLHVKGTADEIQSIIQANTTQTVNLTEWQNSSGATIRAVNAGGRPVNGKTIYTGTATISSGHTHKCVSATSFTLTIPDGGGDGEEIKIYNKGVGTVTLSGNIGSSALSTLVTDEVCVYEWDSTDSEWQ